MEMEKYKPAMTLVLLQFTVAGVTLFTKTAFIEGLSPAVFVVYRQAIATLFICPISFFFTWRKASKPSLGVRGFWWVAFTAILGVTVNQNAYFAGIDLSSSSMASATTNLVPAVTFIISIIVGFERINKSLKSGAKVIGTCVCVGGAMAMTFLRGPKLLNAQLNQDNTTWLLGCFFLLISTFAWSSWLILQVNIAVHCPDHLYTTSWTCFMATIASFLMALALGNTDLHSWKLDSSMKLSCCVYSGLQLAVFFFLQAWCVSRKGPLFSALFNPLSTVIVTFFGTLYLKEKTYLGSLLGALAIILGLYIVLWGKSEDYQEEETDMKLQDEHTNLSQLLIGDKAFRSSEYIRSLRNIGACLRQYAEAETVAAAAASSPSTTKPEKYPSRNSSSYPDDGGDDSDDSPLSHDSSPKPRLNLSYTKSTPPADSTVTITVNPLDEDAMPELFPPPPPRPRRPEASSWDYFDTCDDLDSFRLTEIGCEDALEKSSNVEEDLKTEHRKQRSWEDVVDEREDPSEFITHRAKDFVSSMKDIEHKFFRASDSGKEVSRMLEANKIRVGFADTTGKGNSVAFLAALKRACCRGKKSHSPVFKESLHQQVSKVIVWKRTSSSRSSTSRNPLIETSKEDDDDGEESGSDFIQEFCMISGSHSSSLDRLYAWERKLYDEVKASEMIRKEYDRKCEQLRNQFTKDHSAKAMDKTRAAAKDLHSRIRVAIQSVDSISKRIERIRDEELQPQLLEFLQGLIRMWKSMLECHHSQYITISLAYHCRNSSKNGRDNALKRRIWSELLEETECFGLSFADLVNSMACYVEALNGWLHNCVLLPQERSTRNRRPWSPRRVLAPPIFVLCRDWSAGIKSLPSDELSGSIKEFSADMEMLGEEKDDSVLVCEDLSSVHSSLAKLLERLKKFSEASLKMYEDVKVKSEEALVAYTNHSNCGRPVM